MRCCLPTMRKSAPLRSIIRINVGRDIPRILAASVVVNSCLAGTTTAPIPIMQSGPSCCARAGSLWAGSPYGWLYRPVIAGLTCSDVVIQLEDCKRCWIPRAILENTV